MITKQKTHPEFFNQRKIGNVVEGTVLDNQNRTLFVDLGLLGTGVVRGREYLAARQTIKNLKKGDKISGKIITLENEDGFIELSLRDISKEKNWLRLKEIFNDGEVIEIKIVDANSGGLIGEVDGLRGFLPASQLSLNHYPRVEDGNKNKIAEELKKYIGETFEVKILDIDPLTQKLIFSEKAIISEEMKKALSQYKIGDVVDATVTKVINFGAFVKFGDPPLDGLIHISEFDYKLISNPHEFLKENQTVKAQIISIKDGRISLSLKSLKPDPWLEIEKQYAVDQVIRAKVEQKTNFGYLVNISPEVRGVVKNMPDQPIELEINKEYPFKILALDKKFRHILLAPVNE